MKHIAATLLLAFTCAVAGASQVNWSLASKSFTTSDGASERAKGYYVTVFLYSDYDAVMSAISSLSAPPTDTQVSAVSTYIQGSATTAATGAASGRFELSDTTYPSITTVDLFMVAWDASAIGSAENYLVSEKVQSDAYSGTDNPTNMGGFTSASYSGKSWTAVPEPSTAALALAGLALLLKRRKA